MAIFSSEVNAKTELWGKAMLNPRLFYTLIFAILLSGCSQAVNMMVRSGVVERPEVKVLDAQVIGAGLDGLKMEFKLDIYNPNPIAIDLDGMSYEFEVNDELIVSGTHVDPVQIPAKASSQVVLPMTVNIKQLFNTVSAFNLGQETNYRLNARMQMRLPVVGATTVPVVHKGQFEIPRILTSPLFRQ
ncbi:MAG TPA: hypothetical protein DCZ03_06625 [Gammaproteobacteria bacterium]|nr:hypothetical protein [Gammaproteobacteria bacterium]